MTTIETNISTLPSVYTDWTNTEFEAELHRVHKETEIERLWIEQAGLVPFQTDAEILCEAEKGKLTRVGKGIGYIVIDKLMYWDLSRSDSNHEHYYSNPFLNVDAYEVLESVAQDWQTEMGPSRFLSVTSLGRSNNYQSELASRRRKLTIQGDGNISSHQVFRAFDIDGCGIAEQDDNGNLHKINPRYPNYRNRIIEDSRLVLKSLLHQAKSKFDINVVEELKGTQEHSFHIAVRT